MRLAVILLLAHPALLLTGTMVRALRYSPFEAVLAAVLLAATIALGVAVWRRSPGAYWLAVLVAAGWLTTQGLRLLVTARELSEVASSISYLAGLMISTLLAASALTLLLWHGSPERGARSAHGAGRLVLGAVAVEAALLAAILAFGFALDTSAQTFPWYRLVLGLSQMPGVLALASLGQCCGLAGGIVLSDAIDPFWGGLYPIGTPILGFANAVVLAGVSTTIAALRHRLRKARAASANSHAA